MKYEGISQPSPHMSGAESAQQKQRTSKNWSAHTGTARRILYRQPRNITLDFWEKCCFGRTISFKKKSAGIHDESQRCFSQELSALSKLTTFSNLRNAENKIPTPIYPQNGVKLPTLREKLMAVSINTSRAPLRNHTSGSLFFTFFCEL